MMACSHLKTPTNGTPTKNDGDTNGQRNISWTWELRESNKPLESPRNGKDMHILTIARLPGKRKSIELWRTTAKASGLPRDCQGLSMQEDARSEEHTSELQSPCNLVCRLLLEKKKNTKKPISLSCQPR